VTVMMFNHRCLTIACRTRFWSSIKKWRTNRAQTFRTFQFSFKIRCTY